MPKPVELTSGKLRFKTNLEDSRFLSLYESLMRSSALEEYEYIEILKFAILFLRSDDKVVSQLGYRIILQYTSITNDYQPLYEVARVKELMPIIAAIERIEPDRANDNNLNGAFNAAHQRNFITEDTPGRQIARTRGQMELRSFNNRVTNAVIVAPTSYGKSEMMVDKICQNLQRSICIIVPTRALISQTRASLVADHRIRDARLRVITHPDAYIGDTSFVAVMTQERLQRLFVLQEHLSLDLLLIDEAHNLLPHESRSIELSQVVITAQSRNDKLLLVYYTPFIASAQNLKHVNNDGEDLQSKSVTERVKAEILIYGSLGHRMRVYDQFLNRSIELEQLLPSDEIEALRVLAGSRTIVYVNKPSEAQHLAGRLALRNDIAVIGNRANEAIKAIGDLIHPSYGLIDSIRSGVLFHHGKVPDILRQYIERLFREDDGEGSRFLVTTSTLLEGVNTPADKLIIMTPKRGRPYLTRSGFRNLIGRVGRFKEVFDEERLDLDLLQPHVYLIPSSYAPSKWNIEGYLQEVADLTKDISDRVENPLLAASENSDETKAAIEYLENIEPGATGATDIRTVSTEVGSLCFKNGVRDFDIFEFEEQIQERISNRLLIGEIQTVPDLIDSIVAIFLDNISVSNRILERLRDNVGARKFYSLVLGWRANNEPYKRMIGHFLSYWETLDEELVYVGSSWGEETFGDGEYIKLYVRMRSKSHSERINLAVAKVKEEQDFIDFNLMRYVEVLFSLGAVDQDLYNKIKYGTSDPYVICLLRNGLSPELAHLIQLSYRSNLTVDIKENSVIFLSSLRNAMVKNLENDILIYEATTMIG